KMLRNKLGEIPEKDKGLNGDNAIWAAKDLEDGDWKTMDLPALWEQNGWEKTDGVFWFRKAITMGKGRQMTGATLSLGPIDDNDQTWVNGHKVGEMEAYNKNRVYQVPSKYLKEGTNIITVRVDDTGGGGGIYGDPALLHLKLGDEEISLAGAWKYKVGMVRLNNATQSANQQPTLLYNKMIHPVLKFPIKGVLWYQGESNAGNQKDASEYADHFKTLINSWRGLWAQGDFPFLYVQLANFMAPKGPSEASNWALLRESQTRAMELPNTGQAVIIDIGEENDIHPRNKQDVGYRLGLAAQKLTYGKDVIPSGPVFSEMQAANGKLILKFNYSDNGLKTKDGNAPGGFAIAGADKKFVWADARISGNTVEVFSEEIKEPVAVRYAWGDNPDKANLYNNEDLPATPFRTDQWD
ncbi:MAG: sialate O-acetylesterase, partial [Bacteroidota bacterium]